jgi:Tripartite tricarboxylate transporter TctB family
MDRRIDLGIGIAIVLIGIGVLFMSQHIRSTGPVVDAIGPRAFPYMIGIFFLVGGGWTVLNRLRRWQSEAGHSIEGDGEPDEPDVPASAWQSFAVMTCCALYIAALTTLGYPIATPVFVIAALKAMRMKSWPAVLLIALVYTAATYVIFGHYLRVDLPLGPLTDAFRALGLAR